MAKRNLLGLVTIGAVLSLMAVVPAFADLVTVGNLVKFQSADDRPTVNYGGGLFDVYVNNSTTAAFKTFCLERNEYINFGTNYRVDSIGAAYNGGIGGPSPDPISMQTAYLYSRFYWGSLSGFDITSGNDQRGLQEAIWFFEGELGQTALAAEWVTLANNNAASADLGLVKAFNPVGITDGALKQSMLVYVPEPGTLLLLGSGLLGLALAGARKKFHK